MVYIYLGTNQTMDRAILFEDGMFGRVRRQRFVAGEAGLLTTPTAAPSFPIAPVPTASPVASPTSGTSNAAQWRVTQATMIFLSLSLLGFVF